MYLARYMYVCTSMYGAPQPYADDVPLTDTVLVPVKVVGLPCTMRARTTTCSLGLSIYLCAYNAVNNK